MGDYPRAQIWLEGLMGKFDEADVRNQTDIDDFIKNTKTQQRIKYPDDDKDNQIEGLFRAEFKDILVNRKDQLNEEYAEEVLKEIEKATTPEEITAIKVDTSFEEATIKEINKEKRIIGRRIAEEEKREKFREAGLALTPTEMKERRVTVSSLMKVYDLTLEESEQKIRELRGFEEESFM